MALKVSQGLIDDAAAAAGAAGAAGGLEAIAVVYAKSDRAAASAAILREGTNIYCSTSNATIKLMEIALPVTLFSNEALNADFVALFLAFHLRNIVFQIL